MTHSRSMRAAYVLLVLAAAGVVGHIAVTWGRGLQLESVSELRLFELTLPYWMGAARSFLIAVGLYGFLRLLSGDGRAPRVICLALGAALLGGLASNVQLLLYFSFDRVVIPNAILEAAVIGMAALAAWRLQQAQRSGADAGFIVEAAGCDSNRRQLPKPRSGDMRLAYVLLALAVASAVTHVVITRDYASGSLPLTTLQLIRVALFHWMSAAINVAIAFGLYGFLRLLSGDPGAPRLICLALGAALFSGLARDLSAFLALSFETAVIPNALLDIALVGMATLVARRLQHLQRSGSCAALVSPNDPTPLDAR